MKPRGFLYFQVDATCSASYVLAQLIVLFLLFAALPGVGQDSTGSDDVHIIPRHLPPDPEPTGTVDPALKTHTMPIVKDVDLVLVPVTITDPSNRLVTGLDRQNFVVYEGKEKQEIRHFSSEDAPISLGVIFDVSGSMSNKLDKSKEAVVEFLKTANPEDEFFMISFADKPEIISEFTNSIGDIQAKMALLTSSGKTSLFDAVYLGISRMRQASNQKKALLIISDGGDNHSRYTENEIKSVVKEVDVMIYAMGLYDLAPRTPEELAGPATLAEISEVTGGRMFSIGDPTALTGVAAKIGIELRNQYVIGYRPRTPVHDGRWHKIKVKLIAPRGLPPLRVYAKTGYYAPSQ